MNKFSRNTTLVAAIAATLLLSACAPGPERTLGSERGDTQVMKSFDRPVAERGVAWSKARFGNFDTITVEGEGNLDFAVPENATAGWYKFSRSPGTIGWMSARPFDANGNQIDAATGSSKGDFTGIYGIIAGSETVVRLAVEATGPWTLVIKPVSALLPLPSKDTDSGIYLYDGDAQDVQYSFAGKFFQAIQYSDDGARLAYEHSTGSERDGDLISGPSIVAVYAMNSSWSVSAR